MRYVQRFIPIFASSTSSRLSVYHDPEPEDLRVATLAVPAGSTAYLSHLEHGYLGIGPGSYEIRRQREMVDWVRLVAD